MTASWVRLSGPSPDSSLFSHMVPNRLIRQSGLIFLVVQILGLLGPVGYRQKTHETVHDNSGKHALNSLYRGVRRG